MDQVQGGLCVVRSAHARLPVGAPHLPHDLSGLQGSDNQGGWAVGSKKQKGATMKTRVKLPRLDLPRTRAEAEAVVREIAEAKTEQAALKAEMDARITEIRADYERRLARLDEKIGPLVEAIHAWAEANRSEFGQRKTLEMLHGFIGWRTTPPAVKPLRGLTWAAFLERIKELGRMDFIRVREDVNKEAILAARETEDVERLGVQIVQVDEFFVEPKISKPESPAESKEAK
jgi:phage host-nuclease inhibitor protein Gam